MNPRLWLKHRRYAREAKRRNRIARLMRLKRTEWNGFPLPTGKKGTLRITYAQMLKNPNRISQSQMNQAYFDRGNDLRVDLEVSTDSLTRDVVITWRPHKGRWPKERY